MSRNRSNTACVCRFWALVPNRVPKDAPSLLTADAYFAAIGWPDSPYKESSRGYGFEDRNNGVSVFGYETEDGMGSSNCPNPRYPKKVLWARYAEVPEADRYRFRKLQCAVCRRLYVGWYVLQPWVLEGQWWSISDGPVYSLYDTSYWYAFNDEPHAKDEADAIDWTGRLLADACREFFERHPERFEKTPTMPPIRDQAGIPFEKEPWEDGL